MHSRRFPFLAFTVGSVRKFLVQSLLVNCKRGFVWRAFSSGMAQNHGPLGAAITSKLTESFKVSQSTINFYSHKRITAKRMSKTWPWTLVCKVEALLTFVISNTNQSPWTLPTSVEGVGTPVVPFITHNSYKLKMKIAMLDI